MVVGGTKMNSVLEERVHTIEPLLADTIHPSGVGSQRPLVNRDSRGIHPQLLLVDPEVFP